MKLLLVLVLCLMLSGCAEQVYETWGEGIVDRVTFQEDGFKFDGVRVEHGYGTTVYLNATNHSGSGKISSICTDPWNMELTQDGQLHQAQKPEPVCLAYGEREFLRGETIHAQFSWDGRIWDDGYRASDGDYIWTAVFTTAGEDYKRYELPFEISR